MKTRIVVHIALNAKNERVGNLVEVAGRLIPFEGYCFGNSYNRWSKRVANDWIDINCITPTLKKWKKESAEFDRAVRFQRVTLIGESK